MTNLLLADPMGLGKTIQACGLINHLGLQHHRVLVVCPASLRLNWKYELDKWLVDTMGASVVLSGKEDFRVRLGPLVVSYNLTTDARWSRYLQGFGWQLIIFDEAHNLKNLEAKRTIACLDGLVPRAENTLALTGTPLVNRPHEFYPLLRCLAPRVVDGMSEKQYLNRYTKGVFTSYGYQITGAEHQRELHARLRGSGFMVRRDKRKVLPQLPPERYSLVVFPQDTLTARVVQKEAPFSVQEILEQGKPLGYGALPELRHEMGLAKVPESVAWIKEHMASGCEKLVVFAYHSDVVKALMEALKKFSPRAVTGQTTTKNRQAAVDAFQKDPNVQLIVGGWEPLGVGWTLTAASDVVFVEHPFVPGMIAQCRDRVLRIGQEADAVNIYFLVVEGSLDAYILSKAAGKERDINLVLDGQNIC